MKIYRPVSTNKITQDFGEDKVCVTKEKPYRYTGKLTKRECPDGFESVYKKAGMKGHNGFDFSTSWLEPVYHSADWEGWVKVEKDSNGGVGVEVISNKPINGHYYKLKYWHLDHRLPKEIYDGAKCWPGKLIGYADNTGQSTGTHLHFGLKPCDVGGEPVQRNNGYYGAIDINEYYINEFIGKDFELSEEDLTVFETLKAYGLLKLFPKYLAYQRSKWNKNK